MRVGFDTSPLHRPFPPGIVRVATEVTAELERRGNIEVVRLAPGPDENARRWRHETLPKMARRHDLVGIHSFLSAYPRAGEGKRIQTVHELPWKHGVEENAGWAHRYWASLGTRSADLILTATEHVARDLRKTLFVRGDRVRVCPWGVGKPFEEEPPPAVVDEVVIPRYTKSEDAIALCPGAVREKKNLEATLRGLAELRSRLGSPNIQLLVTGPETPALRRDLGLASQLGLSRWVSTPGEIEEADLPSVLRMSAMVLVLSKSEGFGLPVLEALACGTPVIVSRNSAQSEAAGDAGFEVDAGDPASVADAMERAVREREELRYQLPARAAELSWSACAERIEGYWKELAT